MNRSVFLSILIPVYNWDVRTLLRQIHAQSAALQDSCAIEIIVMDDGSVNRYDTVSVVDKLPLVTYEEFSVNRGRSAIRNLLFERAVGEYILFLDADMLPDHDTFLLNYVAKAKSGCDIICGGISYHINGQDDEDYSFYLYKGLKTEAISVIERNRTPWKYLFTSNIMLRRNIAAAVRFDPRFTGYGFEDIEWAIRLAESYTITHIDNTCRHLGLMTKRQTFFRMRDSVENYTLLLVLHPLETASSSAAKVSGILQVLPDPILGKIDVLLTKLFFRLPWNSIAYVLFQGVKMVLLARTLKKKGKADLY